MKYFHQLTRKEFGKLVGKINYEDLAKKHPQPKWCNYPDALQGVMGCWSLTDFRIKKKKDCKNCDMLLHSSKK